MKGEFSFTSGAANGEGIDTGKYIDVVIEVFLNF